MQRRQLIWRSASWKASAGPWTFTGAGRGKIWHRWAFRFGYQTRCGSRVNTLLARGQAGKKGFQKPPPQTGFSNKTERRGPTMATSRLTECGINRSLSHRGWCWPPDSKEKTIREVAGAGRSYRAVAAGLLAPMIIIT